MKKPSDDREKWAARTRQKNAPLYELRRVKNATAGRHEPGMGAAEVFAPTPERGPKRRRLIRFGTQQTAGKVYANPATSFAYRLRRALDPHRAPSMVIVKDASGKPIAEINPVTRERKAL